MTEGIKAVGGWSQGALHACYDHKLPVDGLLAASGFNGRKQESFFLPQDSLGKLKFQGVSIFVEFILEVPPPELLNSIFPWIEEEEIVLVDHVVRFGKVAKDEALIYFLNLLKYL